MLKQSFLAVFEFSDLGLPGSDRKDGPKEHGESLAAQYRPALKQ